MSITAERYHDISCGHRVHGHESKCAFLHGHNYRVTFVCQATILDEVGRVIDFSVIKEKLCMWLENNWDHKFLAWEDDEFMKRLLRVVEDEHAAKGELDFAMIQLRGMFDMSLVWTEFNPTAENMASWLLHRVGPHQLRGTGVTLIQVRVEETRKCSAVATMEAGQ
jgi:6-pyruvoyltetrahydropterin/6-carboxytetrahydropterin synthase